MMKEKVLKFILIVLFWFVAPFKCNFCSNFCLSGEGTAWTSHSLMQQQFAFV